MFARAAFLLLLLIILPVDSGKLHDILASVGRRSTSVGFGFDKPQVKDILQKLDERLWDALSDKAVSDIKYLMAMKLSNLFASLSSTENIDFEAELSILKSICSEDMTVAVCGDPKTFTYANYFEYVKQAATQYVKAPNAVQRKFLEVNTSRHDLHVYLRSDQIGKNGITVEMHYELRLKFNTTRRIYDMPFLITKITQGGSCLDHGTVNYDTVDEVIDVIEDLENQPLAKSFFSLFTQPIFQHTEELEFSEPNTERVNIPFAFLYRAHWSDDVNITIPQGADAKPTAYSFDEFQTWYGRFQQMWHLNKGDEDGVTIDVLQLRDEKYLTARITMRLRIGTNETAKVHEWKFKFSATYTRSKVWFINQLDVLRPTTITNLMDESYLAYRDVVGSIFSLYMKFPRYSATAFLKHFRKHKKAFKLWNCDYMINNEHDFPKVYRYRDVETNITMLGYINKEEQLLPLPAAKDTSFTIRMKMEPPMTVADGLIFGSDWKLFIEWDEMEQFYFVYKGELSCPKWLDQENAEWGHFRVGGPWDKGLQPMKMKMNDNE